MELYVAPSDAGKMIGRQGRTVAALRTLASIGRREGRQDGDARNPGYTVQRLMDWDAMAVVGRIARAHGIRGQVVVNLETDFLEQTIPAGGDVLRETRGLRESGSRPIVAC